ncbi:MAG: hypothetical protein ACX94A_06115 [Algiphilus sp.]
MANIYLYRLKAIRSKQSPLFGTDITRREFVSELIGTKPSSEIRKGYIWHLGNVQEVDEDAVVFAVGRTTIASREKFDEETGDFVEIDDEDSPFTYVFYDSKISVLGVFPKARLAPTTKGIARSLEKLLNSSTFTLNNGVRIEIAEIPDPEGFINQIHQAYAVVGFRMEFGEPNPFDVEKDFHAPMEGLLKETGGNIGATKVSGQDLDREALEMLTRSVASVGNEASARIRNNRGDRPVTKHLKGDPASVLVEEFGVPKVAAEIIVGIRDTYRRVRRAAEDD